MVNTNELMLGNYVELGNGNIIKITGINEVSISYHNNRIDQYPVITFKGIHPIPITEEILEKCGFYKYETSSGNWFVNDFDDKIFQLNKPRSDEYELVGVASSFKYLHELQNLYFIYRKEQLEVNL